MMVFFPEMYEDELAYSLFARYHVHAGHLTFRATAEDLFVNKDVIPSTEFIVPLTEEAVKMIARTMPLSEFVEKHTMLPYYTRFLPLERRKKAFDLMMAMDRTFYDCLYIRKNKTEMRKYMRYCPLCAAIDRKKYGETYWHRKHQLTGIDICAEHLCRLEDSPVGIASDSQRFTLNHAETVVPYDAAANQEVSAMEVQVARYVQQVFDAPMDFYNEATIGEFLHTKLEKTPYTTARGEVVFARKLFEDILAYYADFPQLTIKAWWYVQKVFCRQNYHTLDICLISYFLKVPISDLLTMQLPDMPIHEKFDYQIMTLHQQGKTYKQIAQIMGISLDAVKSIGERRYNSTMLRF